MQSKNLNRNISVHLNINLKKYLRDELTTLWIRLMGMLTFYHIRDLTGLKSFPEGLFKIPGFPTPSQRDQNELGSGFTIFVRKDIPS